MELEYYSMWHRNQMFKQSLTLIVCVLIQFVSQTVILYFQRACNNVPEDGHRASWKADFN